MGSVGKSIVGTSCTRFVPITSRAISASCGIACLLVLSPCLPDSRRLLAGSVAGTGLRTPETIRTKRPAKTHCPAPETKHPHATRHLAGYLANLRNTRFASKCVVELKGIEHGIQFPDHTGSNSRTLRSSNNPPSAARATLRSALGVSGGGPRAKGACGSAVGTFACAKLTAARNLPGSFGCSRQVQQPCMAFEETRPLHRSRFPYAPGPRCTH